MSYLARVVGIPEDYMQKYPFRNGDIVLFMGEVEQMPEHSVIATRDGKVHFGYHSDWFVKLTEDEA